MYYLLLSLPSDGDDRTYDRTYDHLVYKVMNF